MEWSGQIMIDIERELTAGMRAEVAGVCLGRDVVEAATRRNRRRDVRLRIGFVAGVCVLVGAVAGAVTVVGGVGSRGDDAAGRSDVGQASDVARLRLVSSVTATESVSYAVSVTVTDLSGTTTSTTRGAFDPRTRTGYLDSFPSVSSPVLHDLGMHERLVDGVLFWACSGCQNAGGWKQFPGTYDTLSYGGGLDGVADAAVDPVRLFDALKRQGAKVVQTGSSTFQFDVVIDYPRGRYTFTGTVSVDTDNRISEISYQVTAVAGQDSLGVPPPRKVVVRFSQYGLAVSVERPTNVVQESPQVVVPPR